MPNYPSLSELMAAYQRKGPGDAIDALSTGVQGGMKMAADSEKRKQDFQNKLTELGILQQKTAADTSEAATKAAKVNIDKGGKWEPIAGMLSTSGKPIQNNDITGEMREGTVGATPTAMPHGGSSIAGAAFAQQPPHIQQAAKAYYEGRMIPSVRDRTIMGALANEYALNNNLPAFKGYAAEAAQGTAKAFASGKQAQSVTSLNTALGHLQTAYDNYQALGNWDIKLLNKPLNVLRSETNDANVMKLQTSLNALSGELATTFKNSSGTDQEIKHWMNVLNSDLTPIQAEGVISQVDELLRSRLSALDYSRSTGLTGRAESPLLSPKGAFISQTLGNEQKTFSRPSLDSFKR